MVAFDDVVARSSATAAATFTLPSEVEALGAVVEPEVLPPFAELVASALVRCVCTC